MTGTYQYDRIVEENVSPKSKDEFSLAAEQDSHHRLLTRRPWWYFPAIAFGVATLGFLLMFVLLSPSQHTPIDCGVTATEARAKGCEFDLLLASWIPKPCREYTTNLDYQKWVNDPARKPRPFPYFRDKAGLQPFENETALSEWTEAVYTTWEEHVVHCAYLALHVQRQFVDGQEYKDTRTTTLGHQKHCNGMLVKLIGETERPKDVTAIATDFGVSFETCGG